MQSIFSLGPGAGILHLHSRGGVCMALNSVDKIQEALCVKTVLDEIVSVILLLRLPQSKCCSLLSINSDPAIILDQLQLWPVFSI